MVVVLGIETGLPVITTLNDVLGNARQAESGLRAMEPSSPNKIGFRSLFACGYISENCDLSCPGFVPQSDPGFVIRLNRTPSGSRIN